MISRTLIHNYYPSFPVIFRTYSSEIICTCHYNKVGPFLKSKATQEWSCIYLESTPFCNGGILGFCVLKELNSVVLKCRGPLICLDWSKFSRLDFLWFLGYREGTRDKASEILWTWLRSIWLTTEIRPHRMLGPEMHNYLNTWRLWDSNGLRHII